MRIRLCSYCVLLLLVLLAFGCAPRTPSAAPVAHFVRAIAAANPAQGHLQVVAAVQSFPLYQQAQRSCLNKDYAGAASLLQRLASETHLSAEQLRFVRTQRDICLHDAGLPVPKETPVPVIQTPIGTVVTVPRTPEQADCGPRALLLVCKPLGVSVTLERARELAGTTGYGTSLAGLARAAQALGLKTEGIQVSREALPEVQTPAIAWCNGNRYCALLALHGSGEQGTATIHDPNSSGEETISQERLLRLSGGTLLLVHR